jgi:multidrug efflux system membrane fusion protein
MASLARRNFIMSINGLRRPLLGAGVALALTALGSAAVLLIPESSHSNSPAGTPGPTPVSVAVVEQRDVTLWDEFSGRLEAVERVEVRSRVAGAVQAVHFREGALVAEGDRLITIDPEPYAAEVDRAGAQVAAAEARVALTRSELERGKQLWDSRTVSQRDLDQRLNAQREAEANLRAAQAALQSARLNLGYTEVRAPVAGRVGKLEITIGNLVAAGPGAPVLTTLVSVDPIYASFNADEAVVSRALDVVGAGRNAELDRIPVRMVTATRNGVTFDGHLQLIDNQVDARSGTVRVRAVFSNPDGHLIPGQFARVAMGQGKSEPALLVNERAIGTDQNKKFVLVVGADNKATYREVTTGAFVDGLRVVADGLKPGERIVVNGLQRVRPGAEVAPELVAMDLKPARQAQAAPTTVQR